MLHAWRPLIVCLARHVWLDCDSKRPYPAFLTRSGFATIIGSSRPCCCATSAHCCNSCSSSCRLMSCVKASGSPMASVPCARIKSASVGLVTTCRHGIGQHTAIITAMHSHLLLNAHSWLQMVSTASAPARRVSADGAQQELLCALHV